MADDPRLVGYSIKALSNQIKRYIDSITAKNDVTSLTAMQFGVIGYVGKNSEQRDIFQKDIENEFNIRRSTATGILQLMEQNGLLSREPLSRDARLKKILLTGKAKEVFQKCRQEIMLMEQKMVHGLSDEELDIFFRVIDKITKNIE